MDLRVDEVFQVIVVLQVCLVNRVWPDFPDEMVNQVYPVLQVYS